MVQDGPAVPLFYYIRIVRRRPVLHDFQQLVLHIPIAVQILPGVVAVVQFYLPDFFYLIFFQIFVLSQIFFLFLLFFLFRVRSFYLVLFLKY